MPALAVGRSALSSATIPTRVQEYGFTGFAEKALELGGYQQQVHLGAASFYLTNTRPVFVGRGQPPAQRHVPALLDAAHQRGRCSRCRRRRVRHHGRDEIALGRGFSLTPGIRYDWYEQVPQETEGYGNGNPAYNGLPPTSTGSKFSPSLLGRWEANEKLSFYAAVGAGLHRADPRPALPRPMADPAPISRSAIPTSRPRKAAATRSAPSSATTSSAAASRPSPTSTRTSSIPSS